MIKKIQILGMSEYLPAVIYDIVKDMGVANHLEFFLNIEEVGLKPKMPLYQFPYSVNSKGISPNLDRPVIFGVSGPKLKNLIFSYFRENFKVSKSSFYNVIHKSAYITNSSKIGAGAFIEHQVFIGSQAKIGFGVTIKRGSSIGHHSNIGNFVTINPGVTIAGKVHLGSGALIGIGATLVDGISVGKNTIIGAGSVVTRSIPEGVVAFGNPCKIVRNNAE